MGVGDALMATGEVKELKKKNPYAKFIIGDGNRSYWNEVFDNNPNIIRGSEEKNYNEVIWIKNYDGGRPYRSYGDNFPKDNYNWKKYKALKGEFYFTKKEIEVAEKVISATKKHIGQKKIIFIEPHLKKRRGYENRDWGFHNWQRVVEELNHLYAFLQITYEERKSIKGSININGLNFRTSSAILSMCDLFIGPEGGMMHAAAATNRKAVIVWGGHISPDITGYDFHNHLYNKHPLSPCGSKNVCMHCLEELKKITADEVIAEIKKII